MLRLAICLGLSAACVELLLLATRALVQRQFVFAGIHAAWQTPVSYVVLFGIAGAAVQAFCARWPAARRLAAAGLAALACFSVAFLFHPALHLVAAALMAAGAGWRLAPWLERAEARRTKQIAIGGVSLVALMAITSFAWLSFSERRAHKRLPAARSDAPNVVLLILDTVRAASLGLYGYSRPTSPALEGLAAQGVTFDRAISPSPWTLPSHASIFTGLPPHLLDADWEQPLGAEPVTLAESFAAAGYLTAGFVGNVAYTSRETGLGRGFARYEDYVPTWSALVTSSSPGRFVTNNPRLRSILGKHDILGRRTAADLNQRALAWIDGANRKPFFLFLNYYDAHEPYLPAAPFSSRFGDTTGRELSAIRHLNAHMAERAHKLGMSPAQRDLEQLAYDQSIAWLDDAIGKLMSELNARGLRERTIIAVTADHGEQFGEQGLYSHGNGLYLPALHVPLILAGPGVGPAGTRRAEVVSTTSLGATLLDVARADPGRRFPGVSLLSPLDSGALAISSIRPARNQDPAYPSSRGGMYSATSGRFHVVSGPERAVEVFDLTGDKTGKVPFVSDSTRPGPRREQEAVERVRQESVVRSAKP